MKRILACGMAALALSGCSSIFNGTTQDIYVNTNPGQASCVFTREGAEIARLASTPGQVKVDKTKYDLTITCNKPGYQTATYYDKSGWESGTGGAGIALDVLLTVGLSSAIDSATGADNEYDSPVNVTLIPNVAQSQVPAGATMTPTSAPVAAKPGT